MATYKVTSPTGERFKITAPEGATEEQLTAYAKAQFAKMQSSESSPQRDRITPGSFHYGWIKPTVALGQFAANVLPIGEENKAAVNMEVADLHRRVEEQHAQKLQEPPTFWDKVDRHPLKYMANPQAAPLLAVAGEATKGMDRQQLAGELLNPINLTLMGKVKPAATVLGKIGQGGLLGGLYGGPLRPVTEGEYWPTFAAQTGQGALMGGAMGAGFAGFDKLRAKLRAMRMPRGAQRQLKKAISRDKLTPDELLAKRAEMGEGATIMDAGGENLIRQGNLAAITPGPGAQRMEQTLTQRAKGEYGRLLRGVKKLMGTDKEYFSALDDLVTQRKVESKKFYDAAWTVNIKMTPGLRELAKAPEMQTAMRAATKRLANEKAIRAAKQAGEQVTKKPLHQVSKEALGIPDDKPITWESFKGMFDDVSATHRIPLAGERRPTVGTIDDKLAQNMAGRPQGNSRYWHLVKKELQNKIGTAKRSGASEDVALYTELKNNLRDEIFAQNPMYRKANNMFSSRKGIEDAIEDGAKFMRGDADLTAREFAQLSQSQRDGYLIGALRGFKNYVGKVKDTNSIAQRFENETMRERLRAVSPDDQSYNMFIKMLEKETRYGEVKNKVLAGSQTAARQLTSDDATPGLLANLATGNYKWAGAAALRPLARRAFLQRPEVTDELSKVLTSTDDEFLRKYISALYQPPQAPMGLLRVPMIQQGATLGE